MHKLKEALPVKMETPGTKMRVMGGWGEMVVAYHELPAGTDFTPMLEGLPNDNMPLSTLGIRFERVNPSPIYRRRGRSVKSG